MNIKSGDAADSGLLSTWQNNFGHDLDGERANPALEVKISYSHSEGQLLQCSCQNLGKVNHLSCPELVMIYISETKQFLDLTGLIQLLTAEGCQCVTPLTNPEENTESQTQNC